MVKLKKGDKKELPPEEEAIRQKLYEEYLLKQAEQKAAEAKGSDEEKTDEPAESAQDTAAEPEEKE